MAEEEQEPRIRRVKRPLAVGNWDSFINDMVDSVMEQKRRRVQLERRLNAEEMGLGHAIGLSGRRRV